MKILARTLWETLKFEAVCKLLTICLVYPLLYGVYRIYAASEGLNFNSGVASAFSSPAGVVVLLVVAVGAVAFVFWELSTVVRIVVLTRQGQKFAWRELWWGSLWGLGALRGWSLPTSALFYLGVLPLAGFGYVNSLLPTLSVPEFIFSELRRYGSLGMVAMILLPALGYLLAAALVFVPLSMALGRRTFFQATRESLLAWGRSFRREGRWSGRGFAVLGALLLWLALFTRVAQYWRRNRLGLVDFDAAFFRNLLYSEAFRIDFAYWVVRAVLDTAAMALFIRVLLAVADPEKQLRVLPNPTWQGDAAVLAGVLRRQLGRLRRWVLARWKRWGVRVTAVALCLGLAAWMLAGSPPPQLLHPPAVIGHRGCIYETENTLAAVRAAGDYGAQYAEIDVQLSADGVPVVLHDGNLWRLAGENRNVADLTAEELTSLPLLPTGYGQAGEHLPTLEQVLQHLLGTGMAQRFPPLRQVLPEPRDGFLPRQQPRAAGGEGPGLFQSGAEDFQLPLYRKPQLVDGHPQALQQAGFPLSIVGVQLGVPLAARLFQRRDAPGEIAAQAVGQLYLYDIRFPVFSVGRGHKPVGAAGQRLAHGDVPLPL